MLLTAFVLFSLLPFSHEAGNLRALWNFEAVTECVLHYRALVYNNYGCWCGVGGSHQPVDEIDHCCMIHDRCYDKAVDSKKCFDTAWEYVEPYIWSCQNSTAICMESAQDEPCKAALCDCDTAVVDCWSHYAKPAQKAKCNHVDHPGYSKFFRP